MTFSSTGETTGGSPWKRRVLLGYPLILGVIVSTTAIPAFVMLHNYYAAVGAVFSASVALMVFLVQKKRYTAKPRFFSRMHIVGIGCSCIGIASLATFLAFAIMRNERLTATSLYLGAVWSFLMSKWAVQLAVLSHMFYKEATDPLRLKLNDAC